MLLSYLVTVIIGLALAFLCGSIPFALIIGRAMRGIDVREHGSGNAGTTNALRVLGLGPGLLVFVGDVFKGALGCLIVAVAVGLAVTLASSAAVDAALLALSNASDSASVEIDPLVTVLASGNASYLYDVPMALAILAAILGHMFSPFMGFKGGKGVATALGSIAVVLPLAAGCALAVFIVLVLITRYVSLGSCVAVVTVPLFTWVWYGYSPTFIVFTTLVALAVLWAHRKNLARLARGEESKFSLPKKEQPRS